MNTSVSAGLCRFQKSDRAGVDFIGAHRLQGSVVIDHPVQGGEGGREGGSTSGTCVLQVAASRKELKEIS